MYTHDTSISFGFKRVGSSSAEPRPRWPPACASVNRSPCAADDNFLVLRREANTLGYVCYYYNISLPIMIHIIIIIRIISLLLLTIIIVIRLRRMDSNSGRGEVGVELIDACRDPQCRKTPRRRSKHPRNLECEVRVCI